MTESDSKEKTPLSDNHIESKILGKTDQCPLDPTTAPEIPQTVIDSPYIKKDNPYPHGPEQDLQPQIDEDTSPQISRTTYSPRGPPQSSSTPHILLDLPRTGFLRDKQIHPLLGIARSTWWQWVRESKAPKPIKLGPQITVWRAEDIAALIQELSRDHVNRNKER